MLKKHLESKERPARSGLHESVRSTYDNYNAVLRLLSLFQDFEPPNGIFSPRDLRLAAPGFPRSSVSQGKRIRRRYR